MTVTSAPEPERRKDISKSTSEVHVTADEETPLLSSSGPNIRHGSSSRTSANPNPDEEAPLLRGTASDEHDDDQPKEDLKEKKRRTAGWYIWRAAVFSVTVFLGTIFIKGWIDGDVDVSPLSAELVPRDL